MVATVSEVSMLSFQGELIPAGFPDLLHFPRSARTLPDLASQSVFPAAKPGLSSFQRLTLTRPVPLIACP